MSARRPRTALALMVAVVLAMAPGLFRLHLRTDGHSLVPPDDPAVAADRDARQTFGLRDPLMVVLETRHPAGIFNPATLDRLERLSRELAALPGIGSANVQSLATEHAPRFGAGGGFRLLLPPRPRTPERLAELRQDVQDIDLLHGTLVSHDRRAAAILVGVPASEETDRTALYHRVAGLAAPYGGGLDRVSVVGAPAAEALLGEHVLTDLALLVPLALIIIAAVLWLTCGRLWGMLLGLAKVGAAQVFTLGLIGWSGEPVYLTTAVIPVLLTTVGLSDEIHLLWRYRHRPPGQPADEALRESIRELARPIVLTSLTTAIGFLSFLTSSIRPVSTFGLFAGAGVLFCLAWALIATPAMLALVPSSGIPPAESSPPGPISLHKSATSWRGGIGKWVSVALPVLTVATVALLLGLPRLEVQDGWIENFAPGSSLRQDTERVDRRFAGTHVLQAVLTYNPPKEQIPVIPAASGPLLSANAVNAVGRFEAAMRKEPGVGGVFGLASQLSTTAYLWAGRREESRTIWDNPSWIYLHARRIGNVRGEERRRELVDDGFQRTVVTLLLKGANFRTTEEIMAAARELEKRELAPVHGKLTFAGDVAVSQAMIPAIVRTQTGSLLLALAGNLLIVSLLFRSLRLGLACMAPTALAVAWTFGLMGWLGIPLGVATSIFCAVTLGIGVDYGIHFFERFEAARAAGDPRPDHAAVGEAGPAIVIDALAIALGFGLLAVSQVPADRRLGLLVAAGLLSACLITLTGPAAVLALRDRSREHHAAAPALPEEAR